MATKFTISAVDRMALLSSTSYTVLDGATDANLGGLQNAQEALMRGSDAKGVKSVRTTLDVGDSTPPNDKQSNRGNKALVRIQDTVTGNISNHEIGIFDNDLLPLASNDFLDLTAGVGATYKAAMENYVLSSAGNSIVCLSVQQVERG